MTRFFNTINAINPAPYLVVVEPAQYDMKVAPVFKPSMVPVSANAQISRIVVKIADELIVDVIRPIPLQREHSPHMIIISGTGYRSFGTPWVLGSEYAIE